MKSILRTALAVVCVIVIAICSMMIVQKIVGRARVDLTEHRMYTLAKGTRTIVGKLNQPITLKLYYSRTAAMKGPEGIRFWNTYFLYVRNLLEEYVGLSKGTLALDVIDPRPYTDEEEEAMAYGVTRFPMPGEEYFFFGLVAQTKLGKAEVIEFFEPNRQEFVEYDVSKLISSVTRRERKKIGVLASVPMMGADMSPYMMQMMRMQGRTPPPPWQIVSRLREEYEVVSVNKEVESIEDDIDFLMVVHPKDLPEKTLFAIDQFVMKGGRLLVFVDPHCLTDAPQQDPRNPMGHDSSSNLNALLEGWGVTMDSSVIAADRLLALPTGMRDRPARLLTFLGLNNDCVNADEVVTATLHDLRMYFAGALTKVSGVETTVTPLLTTTPVGNTWKPDGPFALQNPDPEAISRAVDDGATPLMLACRITGTLKTNFPDGLTLEDEKDEEDDSEDDSDAADTAATTQATTTQAATTQAAATQKAETTPKARTLEAVKEAPENTTVLVFADVDMIWDGLAYQETFFGMAQVGDNVPLALNALEFLGGTADLITIRSRGRFQRPFDVVDRIEAEAEKRTANQVASQNERIEAFRKRLRELRDSADKGKDVNLVATAALTERKKVEKELREAEREKRRLQAEKLKRIGALKASLQTHSMLWAPALVLLTAIVLAVIRTIKRRRYAAQRR